MSLDGSPPTWSPEMAHDPQYHYTLREWQRDVLRWAAATKVSYERQGPLLALAVGGAARTRADEISEIALRNGAIIDLGDGRGRVLRSGIELVLAALHKAFPDNEEAEMLRVCLEFFSFTPRGGEKIQVIFFRFDAMLDKANALANLGISFQFRSWMVLALLRLPPTKWAVYLKDMGHRFPRNEEEYRLMQQAIIRERVFVDDVGQLTAQAGGADRKAHPVGFVDGDGTFTVLEDQQLPLYLCLGNPSTSPQTPAFPVVAGGDRNGVSSDVRSESASNLDLTLYNWAGVLDDTDSEASDEESWLADNRLDPWSAEKVAHEKALADGATISSSSTGQGVSQPAGTELPRGSLGCARGS